MSDSSDFERLSEKHKKPNKFLLRTFKMISDPRNSEIVHWTDSGEAFAIKDTDKFTVKLLPKYFKHKNFASFIRQLNMYDFSKCKGSDSCYSHPLFKKGLKQDLFKIRRKLSVKVQKEEVLQKLQSKFTTINSKQEELTEQIAMLRESCEGMALNNQNLLMLIHESKLREMRIQGILEKYLKQFREIPQFLLEFYQKDCKEVVVPVPVPMSHHYITSINFTNY